MLILKHFLTISIFFNLLLLNYAEHLLLAGDSIDRFITLDWCAQHGLSHVGWGDGSIRYRNKLNGYIIPALHCSNKYGDSISFVHIFGSSTHGPYHMGIQSYPQDPFIDTGVRIPKILELYEKEFHSLPDRMIFHSGQWDVPDEYRYDNATTRDLVDHRPVVETYRKNLIERITQILDIFRAKNASVNFGLRTAMTEITGGKYLQEFNEVSRNLSETFHLTLYDMDYDGWALKNFDYSHHTELFRDRVHPRDFVTGPSGSKLLGKRYSSYYKLLGKSYDAQSLRPVAMDPVGTRCAATNFSTESYYSSQISLSPLLRHCQDYSVFLVRKYSGVDKFNVTHFHRSFHYLHRKHASVSSSREKYLKDVYFTTFINGTRYLWSNVSSTFMEFYRFTNADIMHVPDYDLSGFEVRGPVPESAFFMDPDTPALPPVVASTEAAPPKPPSGNEITCVVSTSNRVFVRFPMGVTFYQVNSTDHCLPGSRKVYNVDEFFLTFRPDDVAHGPFKNNALLQVLGDRQVYVIDNGFRRAVWSIDVFIRHGWDIDQVQIIDSTIMELFPMGEPLKT